MTTRQAESIDPVLLDTDSIHVRPGLGEMTRASAASVLGRLGVASMRGTRFIRTNASLIMSDPGMMLNYPDWVIGSRIAYYLCSPVEVGARKLVALASSLGFETLTEIDYSEPLELDE